MYQVFTKEFNYVNSNLSILNIAGIMPSFIQSSTPKSFVKFCKALRVESDFNKILGIEQIHLVYIKIKL